MTAKVHTYADPWPGALLYEVLWNVYPVMVRVHELGLTKEQAMPQLKAMEPLFRRVFKRRKHLSGRERTYESLKACVRIANRKLKVV